MPRRSVPRYCHHKPSGQARVRIDGKDYYLGEFGSPQSHERYASFISNWQMRQTEAPADLTIGQLTVLYLEHCRVHYRKNGELTSTIHVIRGALKRLNRLHRAALVSEFSPRMLKAVREGMIDEGLARTTINGSMEWIRRMFRWGLSEELVPTAVLYALESVRGLQKGRTRARETAPIRPVTESDVNTVLPLVSRQVRDMIRLQLLSGCRPDEIVTLRPCDVNSDGNVWEYVPASHKTEHHDRQRRIYFGPRAQVILAEYMDNRPAEAPCFSPAEAEAERRAKQRQQRKTPVQPSQRDRRKAGAGRKPRETYTVASYRRAIQRACDVAKIERWSPNRLRHSRATDLRQKYGLEAAKTVCGHAKVETTLLYAEADFARARAIMAEAG